MQYDPREIHEMADRLYSFSEAISILVGVVFGGAAAAYHFGRGGAVDDAVAWILIVADGVCGIIVGHSIGLRFRFQAQVALCQAEICELLRAQVHIATQRPPAQVP